MTDIPEERKNILLQRGGNDLDLEIEYQKTLEEIEEIEEIEDEKSIVNSKNYNDTTQQTKLKKFSLLKVIA